MTWFVLSLSLLHLLLYLLCCFRLLQLSGVGWIRRGNFKGTVRSLIDWGRCNLAINTLCEVEAQILPFCVMCFCGFFRDHIHSLSLYWGPLPCTIPDGSNVPSNYLPPWAHNFLLMGSSFFCWSCRLQSEETNWPIENLVPFSLPCYCEQLQ